VTAGDALRRVPDALDELVALVESARALPLSASCVLPREHVLDLLDELRAALPRALEDAREVLVARQELLGQARDRRDRVTDDAHAEADRILVSARERAEAMLAEAEAEAEAMTSAEGVRRAAEAEARGIVEEARQRAERMRAEADTYADERLAAIEDTLRRLLGTVERGRHLLGHAAAQPEQEPEPPAPRDPRRIRT
jgi:cell division septum initiation protein DivIVA